MELEPEPATVAIKARTLSRNAEILAWESAADEIDRSESCASGMGWLHTIEGGWPVAGIGWHGSPGFGLDLFAALVICVVSNGSGSHMTHVLVKIHVWPMPPEHRPTLGVPLDLPHDLVTGAL